MNIFLLDKNIAKCARYHCDKHVIKMILEYAQILSTVCYLNGIETIYKPTHVKHPCVIWAGKSIQNWRWLKRLAAALNAEYRYRYRTSKDHRAFQVIQDLSEPNVPSLGLTSFPQAMPIQYRIAEDPVQAYRNYYIGAKSKFAVWTRRRIPHWFAHH
jgi:hypothetical protein